VTQYDNMRRESEWSTATGATGTSAGEASRRDSEAVLLPKSPHSTTATSPTATGRTKRLASVDDEPPLCAFVVDDDR
jgi:hypothetical protein